MIPILDKDSETDEGKDGCKKYTLKKKKNLKPEKKGAAGMLIFFVRKPEAVVVAGMT